MKLGDVSADSAGPPVTLTPEQAQQVLDLVTTYVRARPSSRCDRAAGHRRSRQGVRRRHAGTRDRHRSERRARRGPARRSPAISTSCRAAGGPRSASATRAATRARHRLDGRRRRRHDRGQGDRCTSCARPTSSCAGRLRRMADHLVQHGRRPASGAGLSPRPRPPTAATAATHRRRQVKRRALTTLLVAPVLCGLLLAGGITAAWLALGEPRAGRGRGVVPGDEARAARATGGAAAAVLRARRSAPAHAPTTPRSRPTTPASPTPST